MALLNIVIWNLGIETSIARIKNTELSLLDIPWVWIPLPAGPFSCITERTRIASGRFIAAFAWIVKGQVRTGEKWPEEEGWMQLGSYSMSMVHGISQGERGFLLFCHCLQKRVHYHTFWEHIFTKETLCPQKTNTEFLQLGSRLAVQFHLLLQCGYGRCHTGNGITGEICCTVARSSVIVRFFLTTWANGGLWFVQMDQCNGSFSFGQNETDADWWISYWINSHISEETQR